MTNKFEKKFRISFVGTIMLIVAISLTGLTGCGSKEEAVNKEVTVKETLSNSNETKSEDTSGKQEVNSVKSQKSEDNKETKTPANPATPKNTGQGASAGTTSKNNKPIIESKSGDGKNSFTQYISLLGLSKENLISTLKEKPNSIGEGGVEFKEAGIRVWFDPKSNTQVEQIFIMRKDMNLNGVKIGDKISRFKEVFGNPVSDKNGDAHFKYNSIFLSVNYDTKTEQTYGLYILRNDF